MRNSKTLITVYIFYCFLLFQYHTACAEASDVEIQPHLLTDVECVLYLMDIEFSSVPVVGIAINDPNLRSSSEIWTCELTDEHESFPGKFEIRGVQMDEFINTHGSVSGKTSIMFHKAVISGDDIIVNVDDVREILDIPDGDRRLKNNRRLSSWTTGEMETLVVRVKSRDGFEPPSVDALYNDIFEDDACLKSQYKACSHDQLIIKEYQGDKGVETVRPGIVEVTVDVNARGSSRSTMVKAARAAAEDMFGEYLGEIFDFVLFCLPPETGNWLAFAYVNGWDSYYNDIWCQSLSAQMHEVGHNLGLAHAGTESSKYADTSGMMGFSFASEDGPIMCFNTPNSWQLGWYSSQEISINPLKDLVAGRRTFTLNGVDDYTGNANSGRYVGVRLARVNSFGDFYIGYNKASGINRGTLRAGNMVTVIDKDGGPYESNESTLEAELKEGDSFTLENFDGSGRDVEVKFVSLSPDKSDAVVEVTDDTADDILISVIDITPINTPDDASEDIDDTPIGPIGVSDENIRNCDNVFKLKLKADGWPTDISWQVKDSNGVTIATSPEYTTSDVLVEQSVCLASGIYTFEIFDSFGDGICCSDNRRGYYQGYMNENRISGFDGGDYQFYDSKLFLAGDASFAPSSLPSSLPSSFPSSTPSRRPSPSPSSVPSLSPSSSPRPTSLVERCGSREELFLLELMTDRYPDESSWELLKVLPDRNEVIASQPNFDQPSSKYTFMTCIAKGGTYRFEMKDMLGDGICCKFGEGWYSFSLDGVEQKRIGVFNHYDVTQFTT